MARVIWADMLSIAVTYFITLCLFPGLESEIRHCVLGEWLPILVMAVFNLSDFVGKVSHRVALGNLGKVLVFLEQCQAESSRRGRMVTMSVTISNTVLWSTGPAWSLWHQLHFRLESAPVPLPHSHWWICLRMSGMEWHPSNPAIQMTYVSVVSLPLLRFTKYAGWDPGPWPCEQAFYH